LGSASMPTSITPTTRPVKKLSSLTY
jgi:hypothetical protein